MNGGEVVFNIKADSSDAKKEIQQTGEAVKDVGGDLEQAKTAAQEFAEAFKEAFKEAYDEAAAGAGEAQSATDAAGAGLDTYKKRLQERVTDTLYDYALQAIQKVLDATKQLVTETAAAGDAIDKNSQRLGMTNEAYQEWSYILSQNGADIGTLTTGMRTLTNQIDALGSGSKTAAASFEKLGLSYEDLSKLTGEQQFSLVVERLQGISDQTERNAIANDVLGRSYMDLVPLLNQSADSVENLRQRAHETGQIMTDEGVTAAVNYTDAMDTLSRSFNGFKQRIGAQILPGITEVAEGITDLVSGVDGAEDKIKDGVDKALAAAEEVIPEIGEVIGRIAGAAAEKAPDIVDSMLDSFVETLPEFKDGFLKLSPIVKEAIADILPEAGDDAAQIVTTITTAILEELSDPQSTVGVLEAFGQFGLNLCSGIADGMMDYDWATAANRLSSGLADVLDDAQKQVQIWLDNTFSGGSVYGGDINKVQTTDFIKNMRKGTEEVTQGIRDFTEVARENYEKGKASLDEVFYTAEQEKPDAITSEMEEIAEDVSAGAGKVEDSAEETGEAAASLDDELAALEQLAEAETKAQAKAAADAEKQLKQEVSAKFRELETEALENGYDDQWLIDQENAFIETLDHESDLYADYHLKLLKQQESYNDKAEKAEKEAADERYKSISKLYEDVAKAQEQLSDSLDVGVSDIFKTETESDKRTGADRKKKSIAIDELEKQIEAKRQLPAKIADLLDSDVPDELIRELLKLDPSDALEYANKLLSSPETMSRITKAFDEDRSLSDQLAGMLTENSEDFDKLGYESGKIFGESFLDSLGEQWKERFGAIVTDEAVFNTLAAALPFMGTMNSVVTDSAQAASTGQRAQAITVEVAGKLTADGDTITAMVNSKNAKTKITSNG